MKRLSIFSAMTLFLAIGCGDDDAGTSANLTKAQDKAVVSAINTAMQNAFTNGDAFNTGKLNPRAMSQIAEFTAKGSCSAGGSGTLEGALTAKSSGTNPKTYTIDYDLTLGLSECAHKADDGKTYTVDGSLAVSGDGELEIKTSPVSTKGSFSSKISGKLDINGGKVDVKDCKIDLTNATTFDSDSGTTKWSGSVCGHDTSGEVSYSI